MPDGPISHAALGRLLLLQSTIHAAPDERRLCEMVAHGLAELPGIASAGVHLDGEWSDEPSAPAPPTSSQPEETLVPIQTPRGSYGNVVLRAQAHVVAGYLPLVRNLANVVAFRVENDRQGAALAALNEDLERRVAERTAALAAEKERLAVTLASIGDAVMATDPTGRITLVNAVAEMLTGWPAAEAVGRSIDEVFRIVEEGTRRPIAGLGALLRQGDAPVGLPSGAVLIARDGQERPVSDSSAPIRDFAGRVLGAVLVFRDQTDERRSRRALEDASERARARAAELQAVLDAVPAAVFITRDRLARHIDANRFCAEMLRVPYGANVSKSAPLRDQPNGFRTMKERREIPAEQLPIQVAARDGIDVRDYEYQVAFEDGTARTLVGNAAPLRDSAGAVTGAVGAFVDITEQKRTEERFRALIEKSMDMILVLDAQGRYLFWSQSAVEALGWATEESIGRRAVEWVHPEDAQRIGQTLERVLSNPGEVSRDSFRYRHKSGSFRQIEATTRNLLHDPSVRGVVVNARDVTEKFLLEEQFRQVQKLESIGRLAGGVAHDFNNLLTVILSCGEALKDDLSRKNGARIEDVEEICAAGERARGLTGQLLAFARKQVIAPVALDLNALLRSSQKMVGRLVGEDIEVAIDLQAGLWNVHADPGQIDQVVLNLVVNAKDAMPRGGKLRIATRNISVSSDDAVRDSDLHPGEWVRAIFRDSGAGMTPEVKAHLFEPFFTTKGQGKGTGLGLATVYGIVKQAGGHVHVVSGEAGAGTTFAIDFPRLHAAITEPLVALTVTPAGGMETVVVVEDDPQVFEVTVRALRSRGYDVIGARRPQRALELSLAEVSRARLLVTDVVMPGMDGHMLADELRRRNPRLRVLYVSGYTPDVIADRGVLDPADDLLPKPFTAPSLLTRVRAILDRNQA